MEVIQEDSFEEQDEELTEEQKKQIRKLERQKKLKQRLDMLKQEEAMAKEVKKKLTLLQKVKRRRIQDVIAEQEAELVKIQQMVEMGSVPQFLELDGLDNSKYERQFREWQQELHDLTSVSHKDTMDPSPLLRISSIGTDHKKRLSELGKDLLRNQKVAEDVDQLRLTTLMDQIQEDKFLLDQALNPDLDDDDLRLGNEDMFSGFSERITRENQPNQFQFQWPEERLSQNPETNWDVVAEQNIDDLLASGNRQGISSKTAFKKSQEENKKDFLETEQEEFQSQRPASASQFQKREKTLFDWAGTQGPILELSNESDIQSIRTKKGFSVSARHNLDKFDDEEDFNDGCDSIYSAFDSNDSSSVNMDDSGAINKGDVSEGEGGKELGDIEVVVPSLTEDQMKLDVQWRQILNEARLELDVKNQASSKPSPVKTDRIQLRDLITVSADRKPQDRYKTTDQITDDDWDIKTTFRVILAECDMSRKKSLNHILTQDQELNRDRMSLKQIYHDQQGDKDFTTLFKLAKCYFSLNKLSQAAEFINSSVKLNPSNQKAQFWKGVIFFYYIHSKKQFPQTPKMSTEKQAETMRVLQSYIKACEAALISVTATELFLNSRYILLKLYLLLLKERFGCNLEGKATMKACKDLAAQINEKDRYIGYLAFCEVYLDGEDQKPDLAQKCLEDLVHNTDQQRPEAYFRLYSLYLQLGRKDEEANRKQNSLKPNEYYKKAVELMERLVQFCQSEVMSSAVKKVLLVVLMSKALHKSRQYIRCFEHLQREFSENTSFSSLLFLYGKYAVKAMETEIKKNEMIKKEDSRSTLLRSVLGEDDFSLDQGYLGSGIGALEECKRACFHERHALVHIKLGLAFKILKLPLKTYEHWKLAKELNQQEKTLSFAQSRTVQLFLEEYNFFQKISGEAEIQVQKIITQNFSPTQNDYNQIQSIIQTLKGIERLDKPNCMLFKARVTSYVLEQGDAIERLSKGTLGAEFVTLLEMFPSFIDGYIQYWKYLKYRMTQQQKKGARTNTIQDASGNKLVEKMRTVAETALYYSDCVEVPTSLWVEARIIYAKQMVFEKDVTKAILVLRDISMIIPPLPVDGLSFKQENIQYSKSAATKLVSDVNNISPNKIAANTKNNAKLEVQQQTTDKKNKAKEAMTDLLAAITNLECQPARDLGFMRTSSQSIIPTKPRRNMDVAKSVSIYNPFSQEREIEKTTSGTLYGKRSPPQKESNHLLVDALQKAKFAFEAGNNTDFRAELQQFDPQANYENEQMAVLESENFAVYSNVEFLYLIGKYASSSKSNEYEGLQALNDYLLIMDYKQATFSQGDFCKQRALALYEIGQIYYNTKDYLEALKYLSPCINDLHEAKCEKQAENAFRQVQKIWQTNISTINWEYF